MSNRGGWILWASIGLIVLLVIGIFLYFSLYHKDYSSKYSDKLSSGQIVNPVSGLSMEQAVQQFNESFVYYLLYSINAYNLHNPPLSSDTPKIEIYVDSDVYNAEISNGEIYVAKGEISTEDIIIKTTKEEAVNMLQDKKYISQSFSSGNSQIQLVASKVTLFGKGYLSLYNQLTGKGITGNVIRIYTS